MMGGGLWCPLTPTPAGTDIPTSVTRPTPSGEDSFAAGILSQLGISVHMADHNDRGLHVAYEKYKAYLNACGIYEVKWLMGAGLARSSLVLISSNFLCPSCFGTLTTSHSFPRP